MKTLKQINIKSYKSKGFIGNYQELIRNTVIPYQYSVLRDEAEGVEKSHVYKNFLNAAKAIKGEDVGDGFYGMVFQDSDAGKWIEAAAYSLTVKADSDLEKKVDDFIDIIEKAQEENGYLNTYFTIKDKEKRWTNLLEAHELYCSGHLMEAAVAYYEATGKDKLLNVMLKNAEHIYDVFITNGHEGYPGHPEVELALLRMYSATSNKHCLELAQHFINVRGVDVHFYEKEQQKRSWQVWGNNPVNYEYQQSNAPVRELSDARGHSVRAVYLYTAMADLASRTGDKELYSACKRLWESITKRQMYITGGIGSTVHGEAFSVDYDLPSDTAYAETCASIGLMFFASRMLENEVKGEYADVMERAFYNTVLAGMQLDGKRFFYVNPLEIIPGISGVSPTHRHDLTTRPGWYACACCPPNVARLISSIGMYAYGENEDTAFCHLFAQGEVSFENGVKFVCETGYPYNFEVVYKVEKGGKMAVRIPSWSKIFEIKTNEKVIEYEEKNGYAYFVANDGGEIKIVLDGGVKFITASTKIPALTGKVAVTRGPLVYCFEGVDNDGDVLSLSLKSGGAVSVIGTDEDLSGALKLEIEAVKIADTDELYSEKEPEKASYKAVAVPYYTWGNRGENQMRIWMEKE